jgi:fatty acid elongase 3
MASFSEFVLLYLPLAPVAMKIPLSAPSTVFSALVAYLAAISGAQILMQSRPPLKLRRIIQAHNLLLCAVSLLLLVLMLDEIVPMVRRVGFLNAMCGGDAYTKVRSPNIDSVYPGLTNSSEINQNLELYYRINYALKYVELLDTLFLTLKKKPLRTLCAKNHFSSKFTYNFLMPQGFFTSTTTHPPSSSATCN